MERELKVKLTTFTRHIVKKKDGENSIPRPSLGGQVLKKCVGCGSLRQMSNSSPWGGPKKGDAYGKPEERNALNTGGQGDHGNSSRIGKSHGSIFPRSGGGGSSINQRKGIKLGRKAETTIF